MTYTPPVSPNVNFVFSAPTYSPPAGNTTNFVFARTPETQLNVGQLLLATL